MRVAEPDSNEAIMTPSGTIQTVRTSLILGAQFEEHDYKVFLREYYRDLRNQIGAETLPSYTPNMVLEVLMPRFEPACATGRPGGRMIALRDFAQRVHRLDLSLTTSDYGTLEKRRSPYAADRATYHLGRELAAATIHMDYPGYNPYRSTRRLNIPFVREGLDHLIECLPDYLWWSLYDQRDMVRNALAPEQLHAVRGRIEAAGYKVDSVGLYLNTFELIQIPGEERFEV
jgi:hypothetical protein